MKSVYRIILLLLLITPVCYATHIKGGEISASYVSGQTYNIKVRLYLDAGNEASSGQSTVNVCFGDGSIKEFTRVQTGTISGSSKVSYSDYIGTHTYGSIGTYQISVSLQNRSSGLINLPNSEQTPFFLWTVINTQLANNTPVMPYPVFEAGVRQLFSIDLKPSVQDQDSVTVKVSRLSKASPGTCGVRMADHSYLFPNEISSSGVFKVDAANKRLVWQAPEVVGNYAYAMVVSEWRDGIVISEMYREGLISVVDRPGETVEVLPYESSEFGGLITSAPQVDSPEVSMAIEAYPVPAEDFVTVKAYSKTRAVIRLQLIDIKGRVIREITSKSPVILVQEEFDVRNLSRGLYIIRADNSAHSVTQKIIH
ncbi:T9SS type A sorting domain-containing protein [Dyadobacter pollutisoli]|uniref:T9SS type A sorting domain-containing protein n=1 Tax=Dyadobacter pollutisoli TaxID=2910158 RepID=A0A9E8NBP0_9BACT|nr:T9SS type A sorting domain-containing protein [Dyadobacter pollutisoli]WAC13690.1 T9SS type A sorting domain-containing protein [Dyadobacter pollutisoli]